MLHKGEHDAGSILLVVSDRGSPARLFERMPHPEGPRTWTLVRSEAADEPGVFAEYLARRTRQDPDLWVLELDIADSERFVGFAAGEG